MTAPRSGRWPGLRAAGLGLIAAVTVTVSAPAAQAQSASAGGRVLAQSSATEFPSQDRIRRRLPRVRIYRNHPYPGPTAVRQCTARYVQEFRPSGTVIVPRMHCWWVAG